MMRRLFLALCLSIWAQVAAAGVNCPMPFTLQNSTIADATQVMANFNAGVACFLQSAAAGNNSDINALLGITTPLAQSSGGSNFYNGLTSTGSANAQVVGSLTPANFTLTTKNFLTFVAGFTNTGPTTVNGGGTGAITVLQRSNSGLVPLAGGEIVATQLVILYYDGTEYQLLQASPQSQVNACTEIDYRGVTVPTGYLFEDGSAKSRTTFANLFACITVQGVAATLNGTTSIQVPNSALFQVGWSVGGTNVTCNSTIQTIPDGTHVTINNAAGASGGSTLTIGPYPQGDCSTTFNIPNAQGRVSAGYDPTATVLTSATCVNSQSFGTNCGVQNHTMLPGDLPVLTSTFTPNGGATTYFLPTVDWGATNVVGGGGANVPTNSRSAVTLGGSVATNAAGNTTGPLSLMQPSGLVQKAIKF